MLLYIFDSNNEMKRASLKIQKQRFLRLGEIGGVFDHTDIRINKNMQKQ